MDKELELEAERVYPIIPNGHSNVNWDRANKQEGFIAGATSKYVEKQKLEFAIGQLKSLGYLHNDDLKTERQRNKIKELEQKLSEL